MSAKPAGQRAVDALIPEAYAAQPGPVNKQGLTGVFVRVTDVCAAASGEVTAADGGGTVLFQADGQNMAPLVAD